MEKKLENPFWVNGDFEWYKDEKTQMFLSSRNDFNLPPLVNLHCCIVVNNVEKIRDYVLIDGNQNIICAYKYPNQYHEYETKIKMLKIAKYYDDCEKRDDVQ